MILFKGVKMKDFDDDSLSPLFVMVVVSFIAVTWLGIYMGSVFLTLIGTVASVFTAVMVAKIGASKHIKEDLYEMRKKRYENLILPLSKCSGSAEEIEAILVKANSSQEDLSLPRNLEVDWNRYRRSVNAEAKERLRCRFIENVNKAKRIFRSKGNFGIQDDFAYSAIIERVVLLSATVCAGLTLCSFALGYVFTNIWWFPYGKAAFSVFSLLGSCLFIWFGLNRLANYILQLSFKKKKPNNPDNGEQKG
jgi:putative Mn2+ efflux pump MntP